LLSGFEGVPEETFEPTEPSARRLCCGFPAMARITPMRLLRIPEPVDHRELVFEPKIDGFRALAYVSGGACELVSRNGNVFKLLSLNGKDMRGLPLLMRKRRLRQIIPSHTRLLYLEHLLERGRDFYRVACERDLEGIVAKYMFGTYQTDGRFTSWLKIKNPDYSQIVDRHELFELDGTRRQSLKPKLPRLALQLD